MTLERDSNGRFVKGGTKNPKAYTWDKNNYNSRKGLTKKNDESVMRQSVNISKAMKQQYLDGTRVPSKENPKIRGENHPNWKGDGVGYAGVHDWIRKEYGTPSLCEYCDTEESKRFEWANITGNYNRERHNWKRLCVKCHRRLDLGGEVCIGQS